MHPCAQWTARGLALLGPLIVLSSCDTLRSFLPGGLSSRTTLTSTTLSGSGTSGSGAPAPSAVLGDNGLEITPDNVTGQVLSLLFAVEDMEDEGVVVFGNNRPDIAPADSDLYDFDFSAPEPITASVALKPGFVGGPSNHMVLLFGYMDMLFTLGGNEQVVRIAFADVDDMQRGDKLLLDASTDTFRWYDLDASAFATERPVNPAAIEEIRDFTDPIRPNMVFYPVNAGLLETVQLDAAELAASSSMDVELDFVMTGVIVLVDEISTGVSDEDLITSLDLRQNMEGYGESGFQVDATVELTVEEESGA